MEGSSRSWSPPEEFEVVVRKDRKHGLGIELSRDCRVIGFHGRAAQDAGVPHGAQLLSVAGINLRGVPSIADASEKEEQMDRLMQSAGHRTAAGDNVTLRLRTVPSPPSSRSSPSPIGRRSRSRRSTYAFIFLWSPFTMKTIDANEWQAVICLKFAFNIQTYFLLSELQMTSDST